MKFAQVLSLGLVLCGVNMVLAGAGVGVPKKEHVPKYLKQLQSPSSSAAERAKAAEMLGKRGEVNADDVEEAIVPLQKALEKDKDAKVRAAAARALGSIHANAAATVPLLVDRVKNDDTLDVKMAAVVALGQFGPGAKEAVAPLREFATKFDAKKSKEGQTIMETLKLIGAAKKK